MVIKLQRVFKSRKVSSTTIHLLPFIHNQQPLLLQNMNMLLDTAASEILQTKACEQDKLLDTICV